MKTIKKLEIRATRKSLSELTDDEKKYLGKPIHDPAYVVSLLKNLLCHEDQEVFLALFLDIKNTVTGYAEISRGTIESSPVDFRVLARYAVMQGSSAVIIAHNHPSGDPTPSSEDLTMTIRISDAAKLIGFTVLDHIIIGHNNYYSMLEKSDITLDQKK